jgi:polysaccharide biosynthesis/export protein
MKKLVFLFLLISGLFSLNSCKVLFPNRMFKEKGYEYLQPSREPITQYVIQPGDQITLQIFARQGFDLLDVILRDTEARAGVGGGMNMMRMGQMGQNFYLVEPDGYVELPIFGRVYAAGFTEKQLEELIEKRSSILFNEPFAILRVTNRRAIVFLGPRGLVVPLNPQPTTLLEVLANAGGLSNDLKAYKIRILRGDLNNPQIIKVDLSTLTGLKDADLIVQTNDVIYVENRLRGTNAVLRELTPVLSLTTTALSLLLIYQRF